MMVQCMCVWVWFKSTFLWQDCVLTLKLPEKLQLYGLYVYYVVHICDYGMLRVKKDKVPSLQ